MSTAQAPGGLVHALLLDGQGGASALSWQEVLDWTPDRGCLWLLFNFEDAETADWLARESGLNEIAVSALTSEETRPRCLVRDEQLLLSLRGVNLTPGAAPEDMVSLRVWSDGRKVISTRRRRLLSTQDVIAELEAGNGPVDAAELLIDWIERIVWRMNETVESYEDQVLALEDAIQYMLKEKLIKKNPLIGKVASVSVGIYNGEPVLDLDYAEDSNAETDMNVVMNDADAFIEVQGTAEGHAFRMDELNAMLALAKKGIGELFEAQDKALSS